MDNPEKKPFINQTQALAKAEHFCAYQERSQREVRDKLYSLGVYGNIVEQVISELIQGNFLNEERFALAYTNGKFKQKSWGKIKIKQGLKLKGVPDKMIAKALKQIDPEEYISTLNTVLEKKSELLKEKNPYTRKSKLLQYATGKGYEREFILDILNAS